MKVMCAHCAKEGKPALIREKEPLDDPMITNGICAEHRRRLYQEIESLRKHMAAPGSRKYARLPVSLPAVGHTPQGSGTPLRGTVREIGDGGLKPEFPVEVPRGSLLRVRIETQRGPLEVNGRVGWTAGANGVVGHGVAFPEPPGEDFALELFLAEGPQSGEGTREITSCRRDWGHARGRAPARSACFLDLHVRRRADPRWLASHSRRDSGRPRS
jgi:hypothetical protein